MAVCGLKYDGLSRLSHIHTRLLEWSGKLDLHAL